MQKDCVGYDTPMAGGRARERDSRWRFGSKFDCSVGKTDAREIPTINGADRKTDVIFFLTVTSYNTIPTCVGWSTLL